MNKDSSTPAQGAKPTRLEFVKTALFDIEQVGRMQALVNIFNKHEAEVEALKAFKAYVHKRLDDAGIEKNPDGEHSKYGCRIGDRLDIVLDRITEIDDVLELVPENERLKASERELYEAAKNTRKLWNPDKYKTALKELDAALSKFEEANKPEQV